MKCATCQAENPDTAKFCNNCGASLETVGNAQETPAPVETPKKRPRWLLIFGAIVAVFVIGAVFAALLAPGEDGKPTPPVATEVEQPTEAPAPSDTPLPTLTPVPSDTPAPTETPIPTDTPTPSVTPTPTDTPIPTPTPTPIVIQGKGQTATDPIVPPASVSVALLTHDGKSNFIVRIYRDDDTELIVNTIGKYRGNRPIWGEEPVTFDIDADGAWSIELRSVGVTDTAVLRGTGDTVSDLFEPPEDVNAWEVFHKGEHNFIVWLHCAGGSELVQNEIGAVDGSTMVQFEEGPCLWEIQADGEWGLKPRDAPPWPTYTPKPTTEPAPTAKPKPPTATPTPVDFSRFPQIGEQVQAGSWAVTVLEVHKRKAVYFYSNSYVAEGHFLIVVVEVTNNGTGTSYFARQDPYLTDKPGNIYTRSSKGSSYAQWMLGGLDSFYTDINPGETRRLAAAYDLPDNVRDVLLSMKAPQWVYLGVFQDMEPEE